MKKQLVLRSSRFAPEQDFEGKNEVYALILEVVPPNLPKSVIYKSFPVGLPLLLSPPCLRETSHKQAKSITKVKFGEDLLIHINL